jgi:putative transposase
MNDLFTYCLAVMAARHGLRVHAAVLMSTHEHLVVTDEHGRLPQFLADFHRVVALGVKVLRHWDGEVWDGAQTSLVELTTPQAIVEKLAYVAGNPVAAGLVAQAADWPGMTTTPRDLCCARRTAPRPALYFDPRNPAWPPTAVLEFTKPEALDMTEAELRRAVTQELHLIEKCALAAMRASKRTVAGPKRVLERSPYDQAKSWEALRSRSPTFAVGRGQRNAFFAAVQALRTFRYAYRVALDQWRKGVRRVLFPQETWLMRVLHGVAIAPT